MFAAARKVLRQKVDADDVIQSLFFKLTDCELSASVWEDPKGYLYRAALTAKAHAKAGGRTRGSRSL